ncbi:Aste57867_5022 [Aphanomyces stellatus]|uniref:Aste57867_5022 protein n=1 Tax=Aphanomyces stellatus TaxID=120398 RepID=A0A485KC79_9STRA|nr:hypothetical protein As57867_005009 [Aphanomyces stellatus]VFT82103.1 Aste57867_5022 [Aphanomyces stellatus]
MGGARVAPGKTQSLVGPNRASIPTAPPRRSAVPTVGGVLYLIATSACSTGYLFLLSPHLTNDFWWAGFNTTGMQTYVGDLYNTHLQSNASGILALEDPGSARPTSYATQASSMAFSTSYGRQILLDTLPLHSAVEALRLSSLDTHVETFMVPHCWVDFGRQFEMAHTDARQARCSDHYQANAAVYVESLLRNVPASDLTSAKFAPHFQVAIFAALKSFDSGQSLLASWQQPWLNIETEVQVWASHGLQYWKTPLQNNNQEGILETITITNAIGYSMPVTIKNIPFALTDNASN